MRHSFDGIIIPDSASSTLFCTVVLFVYGAACMGEEIPPKGHPDSSGWDDLYARDLSNADGATEVWSFDKDVLSATKDKCLWTKDEFENCIVDLEFKNAAGTNSGVIVYCSDTGKWIPNSVEIQIADDYSDKWGKAPKTWQCAAIFGHLPAAKRTVKRHGVWNRMTVVCQDQMLYVVLNDELVTQMDMSQWTSAKKNPDGSDIPSWLSKPKAELPTKGRIGVQGKHAGAPIYFRNLKVKRLP
jgi:hypothetical protein